MTQNPKVQRRKIWELVDFQCPVIGTCLSMGELRKLARKFKLDVAADGSDFEIHSYVVYKCRTKNVLSQQVQKLLNKKFQRAIRRFARVMDTEQLEALWEEALAEGDIPGPFWAVLSHPRADQTLSNRAFGQVHMLSHLVGSANRADIRRLARLEADLDIERGKVDKLRSVLRQFAGKSRREQHARTREVQELRRESSRLTQRLVDCESSLPFGRVRELESLNVMLREKAALAKREAVENSAQVRRLEAERAALLGRINALEQDVRAKTEEVDGLGAVLEKALSGNSCAACEGAEACPALSGKRILYVGGRANLVQHYRALVERSGGEFLHHDGGAECSLCVLNGAMSKADYILFPVDCVSHEACSHIKRMCGKTMKPYVPLRSSGLSSLVRGLGEVVAPA